MARGIVSVLLVFLVWSGLDFILHEFVLKSAYESSSTLWLLAGQKKTGVMHLNVLVSSIVFVSLYAGYARDKSVGTGLKFGFLIGVCLGVGNAYGTYSLMPIPHSITFCWFLARVVEMTAGGIVVGLIMSRRSVPATEWSYYEENQTANSPSS